MYRISYLILCMLYLVTALIVIPLPAQAARSNAPDERHLRAADALLQQIFRAQPGAPKFDAIDAVVKEYKTSNAATQYAIAWLSLAYLQDTHRGVIDRWPCIYVLSRIMYEPAIPYLIDVLLYDKVEVMRSVAAEALGGWYTSTGNKVIYGALSQASRTETSAKVRETIAKYLSTPVIELSLPAPDEGHRKEADALLQQIWDAEPGKAKFDAIDAVVQAYRKSKVKTQDAITWLCLTYMLDKRRGVIDRWPCEYVLSRIMYDPAIPYLTSVLLNDSVEAMRAVAAEALGGWYKSTSNNTIYEALVQSAHTEKSKWVRDTLAKYLGNNMPSPER